jgi:hypothetical protein
VPLPSSGDKFADETDNFRFFVPVSRSIECISLAAFGGGKVSVEDETDDYYMVIHRLDMILNSRDIR